MILISILHRSLMNKRKEVENLCPLKMIETGGKKKSTEGLMYDDQVGTCEWQFLWLVPRIYFEALSKLI